MDHRSGPALADRARAAGGRSLRRAANGLRLWTNVDPPEVGATPRSVVWRRHRSELWRYAGHPRPDRAPVLIVPSVLNRSRILDLQPRTSVVRNVLDADLDAFMLDWGVPDEGDADRDLAGYVEVLRAAIATTLDVSGASEVVLFGYCMGGLLSLLATAAPPELPVRGILALTTPVAVSELGFLVDLFDKGMRPSHVIDDRGLVPAERIAQGFRLIRPSGVLQQRAELWQHLWNDEFLATYRAIAGWVNDPVPMSGALFADWIDLARSPDVVQGRYRLGDRVVTLRDVTCPILSIVADADSFVPRAATDPLLELVGSHDKRELEVAGGHIGVIVGRRAEATIARMVEWLEATASA